MTGQPDPAGRKGDLAWRMVPAAAELAALVHGDGDAADIEALIGCLDGQETAALLVVLAAMTDPGRSPADALAWVTWDEHSRPLPQGARLVMHRGRWRRPARDEACGTPAGYDRHRGRREAACAPCLRAVADAVGGRNAARAIADPAADQEAGAA